MLRIFGDFNRLDSDRRVRLDAGGSAEDLAQHENQIHEGLRVVVDSGDFEADGILEFSGGIWRARIIWETAKNKSQ